MKASILTFQESTNNGALLQAYALQTVLEKVYSEKVDILNYHSEFKSKDYGLKFNKNLPVFFNKVLSTLITKQIKEKSKSFKKDYLNITKQKFNSSLEMKILNDEYDKFYTGSDQVWNPINTGCDETYFLDFVDKQEKKVSYAPSIALKEIPKEFEDIYVKNLNTFSHLSIREASGKKIISDLTGQNAEIVLDPTLLMNKDEWSAIFSDINHPAPYIFVYYISYLPEMMQFVEKLSKETGLEVIVSVKTARDMIFNKKKGFKSVILSPNEFISYINDADVIVTNSFHGTVFSINFEKEFYSFGNKKKLSQGNSRIIDFLDALNLSSRFNPEKSANYRIEYKNVTQELEKLRDKSLKFISNTSNIYEGRNL